MSEEKFIAEVVARVLEKLEAIRKKALVIYTGSELGFSSSLVSLQRLREECGFTFDLFLSRSAEKLLDGKTLRAVLLPDGFYTEGTLDLQPEIFAARYYTVLVPALTVNTAAKLAACIADTPASRMISNSIMRGKNVVLVIDGCCPENPGRAAKGYHMSAAVKAKLRENLTLLQSYGAVICDGNELSYAAMKALKSGSTASDDTKKETVCVTRKKLITLKDIRDLPSGSTLTISSHSLVTQLAREQAFARGVKIKTEEH